MITIDALTNITTKTVPPRINTGLIQYNGSVYHGAAVDGPASWWAFGTSSAYDAQRRFDARFGMNENQLFPTLGVATYRFSSINVVGAPKISTLGGPTDVALISDGAITDLSPPGTIWDLTTQAALTSLTLVGNAGINLGFTSFTAAAGSPFKFLHIYERAGNNSFGSNVSAPTAGLFLDAAGNLNLSGGLAVNVDHMVINAGGIVNFNGAVTTNSLQIFAGGQVQLKSKLVLPTALNIFAPSLTTTQPLNTRGGILDIGSGGLSTASDIMGIDQVLVAGSISAVNITANQRISLGSGYNALPGNTAPLTLSAPLIDIAGGINFVGAGPGGAGASITLLASYLLFDTVSNGIGAVNLDGADGVTLALTTGGNGGTLNVGTVAAPITYDATFNLPITATTGANNGATTGGNGGAINVESSGTVAVTSTMKVSESVAPRASQAGGNITINSRKTTGTAISVSSSAQLLSLLNNIAPGAGGTIKLTSAGGAINVNGKLQADKGRVEVVNNGTAGAVNLANATLSAGTVKAMAMGTNGSLNIGGGTINADTLISLYAGASNGSVNFTDNVTLSGNSVKNIQGNTVTVWDGKVVNVQGPAAASVFTNNPNYSGSGGNGTTSGTFGGNGATTAPLSAGPGPGG